MVETKRKILLVEDDPGIRGLLRKLLSKQGFDVQQTDNGNDGLKLARTEKPDLVLLDWMLGPGPNGIDVCAKLKSFLETRAIPVIVLTGAKIDFQDELAALSSGADLFLTKRAVLDEPGQSSRFFKYLQSLLDRPFKLSDPSAQVSNAQGLKIDLKRHTVSYNDRVIVNLSTKLFDLLYLLARNYPQIVSKDYLLRHIWKGSVQDKEVAVAICRLKAKIEAPGQTIIESVVGRGYRLKIPPMILRDYEKN